MTDKEISELDNLVAGYRGLDRFDAEAGLDRLRREVRHTQPATKLLAARRSWLSIAAALLLLIIAGGVIFATLLTKTTFTAEVDNRTFQLPDGTEVVLKQGSSLTFAADYGKEDRRIELEGEAFFSVIPNAEQPFLAEQDGVVMRVVGTSFNLRIIPEKSIFEVEVSSGKVLLQTKDDEMAIAAHECGRSVAGDLIKVPAPHLNRHAWRTKKIVFDNTSLGEAIGVIQTAYDVIILVGTEHLKACDFALTASFTDASLEDVLTHLEKLSSGKFLRSDDGEVYRLIDWCK